VISFRFSLYWSLLGGGGVDLGSYWSNGQLFLFYLKKKKAFACLLNTHKKDMPIGGDT